MAKFKPQFKRLIYIDQMITEGTRRGVLPNCRTLAVGWEVSQRTIQRDLDYMKWQLSAPIEYDARRRGFYYTEPNYRMPALNISQDDLFAFCIAEKVLQQYVGTPLHDRLAAVFDKLQQSMPENVTVDPSWLDDRLSFFSEPAPILDAQAWGRCFEALRKSRTLQFVYQIPGFETAHERRVDPYHCVGYRAQWYMVGYCHYKKAVRTFAVSRMTDVSVTDDFFHVPDDFDFQKYVGEHFGIFRSEDVHHVEVRFTSTAAPYVLEREWHPSQELKTATDGSIVLSFPASHLFEVKRWILSWGADARVLSPPELAEMIRQDHSAAASQYPSP